MFRYFGTGESFVWRLDEESELPVFYGWVGNNNDNPDTSPQMFMAAKDRLLVVSFLLAFSWSTMLFLLRFLSRQQSCLLFAIHFCVLSR